MMTIRPIRVAALGALLALTTLLPGPMFVAQAAPDPATDPAAVPEATQVAVTPGG